MKKHKVGIIGGGASGIVAAIAAAESGADVTLYEKNDRIGKKILMTGNGKCNFSNLDFSCSCYHGSDVENLPDIFSQFPVSDTVAFFHDHGLLAREKNGYLYPACEQASALLDVLRFTLNSLPVRVETQQNVSKIEKKQRFTVHTQNGREDFDRVILSCGSKAGLQNTKDSNGIRLAAMLGHSIVPLVPALVQLKCKEAFFKALAGVRCRAHISLFDGKIPVASESGELQLTDYGISGIPVFQLSGQAGRLLAAGKKLTAEIDFLPEFPEREWISLMLSRKERQSGQNLEEFLTGILNKKISAVLIRESGISAKEPLNKIDEKAISEIAGSMKHFRVTVTESNSFSHAQVCAGGVPLGELGTHLESLRCRGLYITGELIDVDGRCGGYNLQWAWTSGHVAGLYAAKES